MARLHPRQVVRDGPQIVARPAPLGASPVEIVVGEVDQREQHVGPGHVAQADARAPALIAVVRGAQLIPVVVPERDAVHQRRRDHAIPVEAIDVGVRVLVAEVVERHRQAAARAVARRHDQHFAPVHQEAEAILARQVVIDLDAELVPRVGVDLVARRVGEVVADARQVGPHRRQLDHLAADAAEALDRDLVVRERIADEAGAVRVGPRRRRIVDGNQLAARVAPLREVAVVHRRDRDGDGLRRRRRLVAVGLVGGEEERLVAAVVQLRDHHGAAEHAAEIVLRDLRLGASERLAEEVVGVEGVVAHELEDLAAPLVGARARDEADRAAAGMAELRLEPVGVDRELGDGLDRRRVERRPEALLERRARRGRHAVDRQIPAAFLAAADDDVAAAAVAAGAGLGLRRDQAEVERRSQLAADDERQVLDELAADRGRHLDAVGLDLPRLGRHRDRVLAGRRARACRRRAAWRRR